MQEERPGWFKGTQRRPLSAAPDLPRPAPLLFDAEHRPVQTLAAWNARKVGFRRDWSKFLGLYEGPKGTNDYQVVREDRPRGVVRQLVRYESERGELVQGYLLIPDPVRRGSPGVVVLHATSDLTIRQPAGVEGPADLHLGLHLAERGYVAFCPENFLWRHAPPGRPRVAMEWLNQRHPGAKGMAKMLFDARRAVDLLSAHPAVDPRRIGALGHSLGGKQVLYLSAFDERVRVSVASELGLTFRQSNWEAPWYLGEEIRKPGFDLDHGQVLAMSAPRAFLVIAGQSADGDESWPFVAATLPVWRLTGLPEGVGLDNHRQGHTFPAVARAHADEWLDWFLRTA